MSRKLSFAVLLGLILVVGALLFQILAPLLFPLFFAVVLVVLFQPCYRWAQRVCRSHRRAAALLVTAGIILGVMLPLTGVVLLVGYELAEAGQGLVGTIHLQSGADLQRDLDELQHRPWLKRIVAHARPYLSEKNLDALRATAADAIGAITTAIYQRTLSIAANVVTFLIGTTIMALALYYFFADGEEMLAELRRLSPLEAHDERILIHKFAEICRGVVLGTIVAAVAQGALAGVAYAIVGIGQIWLLVLITILCAFLPLVGAAAAWGGVAIVLLFEHRFGAAIFMTIYGAIIVTGSDNLIRAYVIQGRTQLHPLVAIVTVLGGIQAVGLWGIFLGPMVAVFFYALLNILQPKLSDKPGAQDEKPPPAAAKAEPAS